ncbi:hypothetical protein D3C86_1360890 [compost metagenome]
MGVCRRDSSDGGRGSALGLELPLTEAEITRKLEVRTDLLPGVEIGRVAIKLRNERSARAGVVVVLLAGSEIRC